LIVQTRTKKFQENHQPIPPPPPQQSLISMLDGYYNVNDEFEAYFLLYVILNAFHIIALGLQMKFKGNKGILAKISQLYVLMPAVNFVFIVVLVWARFEFTA